MRVGIFPWVPTALDTYQIQTVAKLEDLGHEVVKIPFRSFLPLFYLSRRKDCDVIFLDWMHGVYTSKGLLQTWFKFAFSLLDFALYRKESQPLVWNIHNLHRHDKRHQRLERLCFRKLGKKVPFIRIFEKYHEESVRGYLNVSKDKKVVHIPQVLYQRDLTSMISPSGVSESTQNKVRLLFFGRIRPGKGIVSFLKSFLEAQLDDFHLILAGESNDAQAAREIQKLAEGRGNVEVHMRFFAEEELEVLFQSVDAMVLPYTYILNSGVKTLSETYQVPVVANDIEALREALKPQTSMVFDLHSPESLKENLRGVTKDDLAKLRSNYGQGFESFEAEVSQFLNEFILNKKGS